MMIVFVTMVIIGGVAPVHFAEGLENLNITAIENFSTDKSFNLIITELDWNTLSEQAIDQKLVAAGENPIFDPNNPFYTMSVQEIESLSSKSFEAMAGDYFGDSMAFDHESAEQNPHDIITTKDWETLSEQAIDQKLINAGYTPIFDANNPFYEMSISELKDLSEDEYLKIAGTYYEE